MYSMSTHHTWTPRLPSSVHNCHTITQYTTVTPSHSTQQSHHHTVHNSHTITLVHNSHTITQYTTPHTITSVHNSHTITLVHIHPHTDLTLTQQAHSSHSTQQSHHHTVHTVTPSHSTHYETERHLLIIVTPFLSDWGSQTDEVCLCSWWREVSWTARGRRDTVSSSHCLRHLRYRSHLLLTPLRRELQDLTRWQLCTHWWCASCLTPVMVSLSPQYYVMV